VSAAPARRCRRRPPEPGALRPSDVLAVFFTLALAFLLAGAAAAAAYAAGWEEGRWLGLHLAFLGGVSQLVLGASQFFAGAFLQTTPPPRPLVLAQLATWNAGALAVAVGVAAGPTALAAAGGALLLAGLGCYLAALAAMARRSLRQAPWALRWYRACAAFIALGAVAGVALAHGEAPAGADLLGAHLALNLGGWFGTAIVGTLHTFWPSLTGTTLRFPRLEPPTFAAWVGGVALLAGGYATGADAVAAAGWPVLLLAACLLGANVAACWHDAGDALSLPTRIVGVGQAALVAGLAVAAAVALADAPGAPLSGDHRPVTAALLVAGWIGLTVLGSLAHLLAVLRRVRDLRAALPASRPRRDGALALAAALGVAALAAGAAASLRPLGAAGAVALGVVYAALAVRILRAAGHALAAGGLRLRHD
jgi:nitrite reductase (NO-forming)